MDDKKLFSLKQATAALGVSRAKIRAAMDSGEIESVRSNRSRMIVGQSLASYARKNSIVWNFEPALTREQLDVGEARIQGSGDVAIARRLTMLALCQSRAEIASQIRSRKDYEALMTWIETAVTYVQYCQSSLELAEAAQARLLSIGEELISSKRRSR